MLNCDGSGILEDDMSSQRISRNEICVSSFFPRNRGSYSRKEIEHEEIKQFPRNPYGAERYTVLHGRFARFQSPRMTKKRVGYENDYENEIEHILLLIPHSTHDFQSVLRNVSTLFIKWASHDDLFPRPRVFSRSCFDFQFIAAILKIEKTLGTRLEKQVAEASVPLLLEHANIRLLKICDFCQN